MSNEIQKLPVEQFVDRIDVREKFNSVLGKKTASFMASIVSSVKQNDQLLKCKPDSIVSAAFIAASLDLTVNSNLGYAYIVPYGGSAQFQMGYKGYIQLALRTGQYEKMNVDEVFDGEIEEYNRFTGDFKFGTRKSKKIIGYIAYFRLKSGFEKYKYMTVEEAQEHGKKYSKSFNSNNGQWKKNPHGMGQKTVIKLLLSKFGLLSSDVEMAIESDQAVVKMDNDKITYDYSDKIQEAEQVDEIKMPEAVENESTKINQGQAGLLLSFASQKKVTDAKLKLYLKNTFNIENVEDILCDWYDMIAEWIINEA